MKVQCLETGEIFDSPWAAAKFVGVGNPRSIYASISKGHSFHGFNFKPLEDQEVDKYNTPPSLCYACQNTREDLCPWFDADNPRPVPGWVAVKKVISYKQVPTEVYVVQQCPRFTSEKGK